MKNNQNPNYALAYLDEETQDESLTSNNEESDPSLVGDNVQDEPIDTSKDFRKNPVFRKLTGEVKETRKALSDAEERYNAMQAQIEELKSRQATQEAETSQEVPEYWAKAYETKEQAQSAWDIMQKHDNELLQRVDTLAEDKARRYYEADTEAQSQWENHIDTELNTLQEKFPNLDVLSDTPQAKKLRQGIRKVWEEYSPQNEEGEYIFIPIEKAYNILQNDLKLSRGNNQERKNFASLSTVRSFPNEAPSNVRPAPMQGRSTSKFGRLPWRSQMDPNE